MRGGNSSIHTKSENMKQKITVAGKLVNYVSVSEISSRIALTLRGVCRQLKDGFLVTVHNIAQDNFSSIFITNRDDDEFGCNLVIETGQYSDETVYTTLRYERMEHLYVTWDTPKLVSFCFIQEGRFYLINVKTNASVDTICDVDRRTVLPVKVDEEMLKKRRSFYHIGKFEVEEEIPEIEEVEEEKKEEKVEEKEEAGDEQPPKPKPSKKASKTIRDKKTGKIIRD